MAGSQSLGSDGVSLQLPGQIALDAAQRDVVQRWVAQYDSAVRDIEVDREQIRMVRDYHRGQVDAMNNSLQQSEHALKKCKMKRDREAMRACRATLRSCFRNCGYLEHSKRGRFKSRADEVDSFCCERCMKGDQHVPHGRLCEGAEFQSQWDPTEWLTGELDD
jgi:hypothetical protein